MGRRVWAIVRALSGCERKASSLSLSLSFSLVFFFSLFLPLFLAISLSFRFGLELPLFYYFQTRHFFSETILSLSLSSSFSGRGEALQKNMLKIAQSRRLALLGALLIWIGERENELALMKGKISSEAKLD